MKKILLAVILILFLAALVIISRYEPNEQNLTNSALITQNTENLDALPKEKLRVPVLVYHHIAKAPANTAAAAKSFFIEPQWLEKHLQYLKENGFETIGFADITAHFEYGMPLPARPVIISFDDGYKNVFDNAFPLLKKYNMRGTFYVITKLLDKPNRMTWEQLAELRDSGMEIGSHTLWHPYLTKSGKVKQEIADSQKILEEKLNITVTTFAYPYGISNSRIENLVKEAGYKTGRSYADGDGITHENLFRIPVIRIYANVGLKRWDKQLGIE